VLRIIFASARSASFTAVDVGNMSATSGSKTTTFVPSAKRAAYLPRTPFEKSYSGRISSPDFVRGVLDVFFIMSSLTLGGESYGDDSDALVSFGECYHEEAAVARKTEF